MARLNHGSRRGHRIAVVLMLLAAAMAAVAATGTLPVLFVSLALLFTATALGFAVQAQGGVR